MNNEAPKLDAAFIFDPVYILGCPDVVEADERGVGSQCPARMKSVACDCCSGWMRAIGSTLPPPPPPDTICNHDRLHSTAPPPPTFSNGRPLGAAPENNNKPGEGMTPCCTNMCHVPCDSTVPTACRGAAPHFCCCSRC